MTASAPPASTPDLGVDHVEQEGVGSDAGKLRSLRPRDLAVRFGFGAAVSVVAAAVGQAAGERAGGVLLAFPAILPAALTLIESREGTSAAVSDVRGAVVGALGMLGFALTVVALVGRMPALLALSVATLTWVVVSVALYFGGTRLAALLDEQQYLPDVGVIEAVPAAEALRSAGLTVGVAESCSGGVVSALLTAVPGASEVMRGGVVAYTDEAKCRVLGVPATLLEEEGPVSSAAARAMADGVRRALGSDVGLAVTGVIGTPADGIPPGRIFVGAVGPRGVRVTRLEGDRGPEANRGRAAREALRLCSEVVTGH